MTKVRSSFFFYELYYLELINEGYNPLIKISLNFNFLRKIDYRHYFGR